MTALWFEHALIGSDWARRVRVTIVDGLVTGIESGAEPQGTDERHGIGLPGMPNVHSHTFQRAMAGLTEYRQSAHDDFWSWRDLMYRFANALTPEELEAIAAFAFVEMLESGFTRVGEFHYVHHRPDGTSYADRAEMSARIAAAAEQSGIALTLLPVFYAHGGFGGIAPGQGQRRFINDVDGFAALLDAAQSSMAALPDAILGVAPHSLRATTPDELRRLAALRPDAPIHIHIAEQVKEVDDCVGWSGKRPVEWLLSELAADRRWCLVHATHLSDSERGRLAASGAVAGLCPITEANLGDGIFPAVAFMESGGAIAIGSDSNVSIDMAGELRLLEYSQRLTLRRRCALASSDYPSVGGRLYRAALEGGGQALGAAAGLAVGRPADLVSLDMRDPAFADRNGDQFLDSLVFAAKSPVDCVWRRGQRVVSQGRHRDREAIERRYRAALARLVQA